jgi:hypothetical protein
VAPEVPLTVPISSSGYTPGQVVVPSSIPIPAGSTSASFVVSAASAIGYQVQNPVLSLVPVAGSTLGSPSSQSLLVTDDITGITYNGAWGFAAGTGSGVGTGASWSLSGNVTVGGGGLTTGGVYPTDSAQVSLTGGSVTFDPNQFTVGVKFTLSDVSDQHPVIVGGTGYRWFMPVVDAGGNLSIDLNNHSVSLPLGMTITPGTTSTLVVDIDVAGLTVTAWLNGTKATVALPSGFSMNAPSFDFSFTTLDYSRGKSFKGTWDWVFAVNGLLSYDTVVGLASGAGL